MSGYQIVLVPYDGSEDSKNSITEGLKFSEIFNSKLIILFVIEDRLLSKNIFHLPRTRSKTFTEKTADEEFIENMKSAVSNHLRTSAAGIFADIAQEDYKTVKRSELEYIVEHGVASEKILEVSRQFHADIIIMGRKGLKNIGKFKAIGSVSRKVAEKADVPVLFVSHASKEQYKNILIPHDIEYPESINASLESALDITSKLNEYSITVLHVIPEFPIPPFLSNMGFKSKVKNEEISFQEYTKEIYIKQKSQAHNLIKKEIEKFGKNIDIKITYGDPATAITEYVKSEGMDLVIMNLNSLKGISVLSSLGSIARTVSETVDCPVMLNRPSVG